MVESNHRPAILFRAPFQAYHILSRKLACRAAPGTPKRRQQAQQPWGLPPPITVVFAHVALPLCWLRDAWSSLFMIDLASSRWCCAVPIACSRTGRSCGDA